MTAMMTDRQNARPAPGNAEAQARLIPQMTMMSRALWESPLRATLLTFGAAVLVIILVTAYGQIRLNSWNQPFYDALSRRNLRDFVHQLAVFGVIAGSLLALNVAQRFFTEMLKLKLRQGLVNDLIHHWLQPGRAFRLANAGAIGVNPDQRMHEDARHLTELSADLGVGLLQASILLATFISVLWSLSMHFTVHVGARSVTIPGYMVWAAVIYSGSASLLSYWVGRSLIDRNAQRYAREADLRFSMVRVNEHIDAIALSGGERDEEHRIALDFTAVLDATRHLVLGLTNLTWITAGYGWFTTVAPILVAAPLYFGGTLTFGGLMMAAGAFIQVQSSLRWFVDNFSTIADWRATLLRVASFRRAVIDADDLHDVASRIEYVANDADTLTFDELVICTPAGSTLLAESHVEVSRGDRIVIVGEAGTGKTLLFRALAGLWPWGSGRITRPAPSTIYYMPRTPYLPPGTLREVLTYPSQNDSFDTAAFAPALERLGLDRLIPMLDEAHRWDRELSDEEQQSLTFSRILLHKPRFIIIDEVFDALDEEGLQRIMNVLSMELKQTGVIYIGRDLQSHAVFEKVVHLVKDPERRLANQPRPAAVA